mmetsp:Transcript_52441/g.125302  ORF Transcript_52441/g.125302 Transcript_52441/m.125302 type:complete len:858 (+) Transcript_52441:160-2733(+)
MTDAELNRIEDAILEKVAQRTPPRMCEDTYLVKAFRFQDVTSTGYCDFDKFKKALMPFASGIRDSALEQVFKRYAGNGALNYKVFSSEFVSGIRRQAELQSAAQGEASWETVDDTLGRMKAYLHSRGPRGIAAFAVAFRDTDAQGTRTLSAEVFTQLLVDFFAATECQVTEEQADQVFQTFRQTYAPGSIAYDELFLALRVEPGPERRSCIRAAFRRLDLTSEGLVDMNEALQSFSAGRHPQVSDGTRQPEDVLAEFSETLADIVSFRRGQNTYPTNLVAWEEFEDYYKMINGCFESDALFCAILQRVWDLDKVDDIKKQGGKNVLAPAAGLPPKSRAGLHHWQTNTLPENMAGRKASAIVDVGEVLLRARQVIAQRGLRAAVDTVKNFYACDDDVNDILDVYEFRRACKQSGLSFSTQEEQAIFEVCGEGPAHTPKGIGQLKLLQFLEMLHGTLEGARLEVTQQVFRSLGGNPQDAGSTIPPSVLKERYAIDAHPRVLRGEVEAGFLLGEFLDTFSVLAHVRGGCLNGMVSFSDFAAYYEVVSSTFENDTYFDFLMRRLWSLPPGPLMPEGETPAEGEVLISPRTGLKKVHMYNPRTDSPMASPRPPAHSGASAYADNGQDGSMSHRRYLRTAAPAPGEAAAPKPVCYSPITKSSIVFKDAIPGPVQSMISSLREAIVRRGLKGWMLLAQAFKKYDTRKNGTVTRLDWERTNKLLGLGLSPEEREGLYRQYTSGRKDGAFKYEDCLKHLKPSLSEVEQASVSTLFDTLREGEETILADTFKAAFDPVCTPVCMLKKKTPDQALQEFCDAVDYFCESEITVEALFDFFTMVRASCEEEDEFHVMTTAAFGVSKQAWR